MSQNLQGRHEKSGVHCCSSTPRARHAPAWLVPVIIATLISLWCLTAQGEILKFDTSKISRDYFDFKMVCTEMGHQHVLLASATETGDVDCMGRNVSPMEFCQKKMGSDPQFLRGLIHDKLKEVVCEKAEQATLKVACDKRDKAYCSNAKAGCEKLQPMFAKNLKLSRYLVESNERLVDDILSCYFLTEFDETALPSVL
jgi:hypothetical protein